jgi:signal transduction histidine kinase
VTEGGGSHVRIEVEDTGMGIPQKYLDKVFEPYFTHGKPDGTGLGLALAKKIVEDHKGRMEIQSNEGTGTTVTIILPAERRTNA